MSGASAALRRDAESAIAPFPPLLATASRLAASVAIGAHGRRRAGPGESFWQYRAAVAGDPYPLIDWRRSARSRTLLVRETEWEAAQTLWLWPDDAMSMQFRSTAAGDTKHRRAALLALALAVLLVRSGERVGIAGVGGVPAGVGGVQLKRIADRLVDATGTEEYGVPPTPPASRGGWLVLLSDFLGEWDRIETRLRAAVACGLEGCLVQVVDSSEEAFPFSGRTEFESMGGSLRYRAESADALAGGYAQELASLRDRLRDFARQRNWQFTVHRTDASARAALVWLAAAIGGGR